MDTNNIPLEIPLEIPWISNNLDHKFQNHFLKKTSYMWNALAEDLETLWLLWIVCMQEEWCCETKFQ
jgi:hypothetical protein